MARVGVTTERLLVDVVPLDLKHQRSAMKRPVERPLFAAIGVLAIIAAGWFGITTLSGVRVVPTPTASLCIPDPPPISAPAAVDCKVIGIVIGTGPLTVEVDSRGHVTFDGIPTTWQAAPVRTPVTLDVPSGSLVIMSPKGQVSVRPSARVQTLVHF